TEIFEWSFDWEKAGGIFSPDISANNDKAVVISSHRTVHILDLVNKKIQASTPRGNLRETIAARFAPDGTRVISAWNDNTARIWNAQDAQLLAVFKGHTDEITSVTFSPNQTRVLTTSIDRTARVWDANRGHELFRLGGHHGTVRKAAFDPDGR